MQSVDNSASISCNFCLLAGLAFNCV